MFAVVTPKEIHLPPGTVLKLPGSWDEYQSLSAQLGDRSSPRIKYRPWRNSVDGTATRTRTQS